MVSNQTESHEYQTYDSEVYHMMSDVPHPQAISTELKLVFNSAPKNYTKYMYCKALLQYGTVGNYLQIAKNEF